MDDVHCIPFRNTGYFSDLICDYLDQSKSLRDFYNRFPDIQSFKDQITEKSDFPIANREVLVNTLKRQYSEFSGRKDFIPTESNIQSLGDANTFTITTGHQLCLFTGPLYFIYKIVSVINLCEKLGSEYPGKKFVPVYWMASEDHDFAEINHINYSGGRISWNLDASGPVGRLKTESLKSVLEDLKENAGPGKNAEYIYDLLKEAYLEHSNLADATRFLVHELFKDKGLVIVEADDAELKRIAIPHFEKDLVEHIPQQKVNSSSEKLAKSYFNQINPREINLFYIEEGIRERIEKQGNQWKVLKTNINWSKEELLEELNQHPERFSPNVVLRPLYQELILPNLAYIGGGGEIAYWFQLKAMFDSFQLPFPILMLRNSVLGQSSRQLERMTKLEMEPKDFFQPLHKIQNNIAAKSAPIDPEMDEYHQQLEEMFNDLETVANLTDRSMLGAVNAQRQKQLNGLENLKKKLLRAEKRKNSDVMERIQILHSELFPKGGLQERTDNFIAFYLEYGKDWIENLYKRLDPLLFEFTILKWK